MKNRCIAVAAHQVTGKTVELIRVLMEQCSPRYDVFLIYDNSARDYRHGLAASAKVHLFDLDYLGRQYDLTSCHERGGIIPGNCIFPFLDFMRWYNYEIIWCLEYDVWFTGAWTTLFDCFEHNGCGLLGTTLRTPETHPHWFWWNSLVAPPMVRSDFQRLAAYLPAFRLTREAADALEASYAAGWRGHTEVSVPTIIDYVGLGVEDIAAVSQANPLRPRFYDNSPGRPKLSPGTFVCPPAEFEPVYRENFLYHPVKTIEDVARIRGQHEAAITAASGDD